jgi:TRAP-type C4-dicarboxylate transport system permease large subunit
MNLLIAAFRFDRPLLEVCRSTLPFFFVLLVVLMLVTYVPELIIGVGGN